MDAATHPLGLPGGFFFWRRNEEEGKMGKAFAMSGAIDWLKAASLRKMSAKNREKDTKESIQGKIKLLRKPAKRTLKGSKGEKWQGMSPKKT